MTTLADLAGLVRSNNAGPFLLTIDILFGDVESYERVLRSGRIDAAMVAELYRVDPAVVEIHHYPPGRAIKITMPRRVVNGSPGDPDVSGGQQYAPLVDVEID